MSRDTPSGFTFDYDRAFSRNIGWVTRDEQQRLRRARVAVAGLGGVGGAHVLTLSRLGIANFNIADFDEFDVHNMNRQAAAFMSSMGRPRSRSSPKWPATSIRKAISACSATASPTPTSMNS
nr:ThiF family adenylyltransferase [Mitsuaria sp. TWR114]